MDKLTILDTAIKIGLGSLIAGVASYSTAKHNAKKEKSKFILEHKIKSFESSMEKIENYINAISLFCGYVLSFSRSASEGGASNIDINTYESITNQDMKLVESWKDYGFAIARLRLLRGDKLIEKIELIYEVEKEIREIVLFQKRIPTIAECEEWRKQLKAHTRATHDAAADLYEQICS